MKKPSLCLLLVLLLLSASLFPNSSVHAALNKPKAPKNLKAEQISSSTIRLSWEPVAGAKGYEVYYKSGDRFLYMSTPITCMYEVNSTIDEQTTYTYQVRVYVYSGLDKIYSDFASTSITTYSSLLVNIENMSSSSNKLSWNSYSGAQGYSIYRAASLDGEYKCIASTSQLTYTDLTLKARTTYYYKIKYYKLIGANTVYSQFSCAVSAKTLPAGVKYTVILFVGNSLTSTSEIPRQVQWMANTKGKYVKVYFDFAPGAFLLDHQKHFNRGYFKEQRMSADIVFMQAFPGEVKNQNVDRNFAQYFKNNAKIYFLPIFNCYVEWFEHDKDIPGVSVLNTDYLSTYLIKSKQDEAQYHTSDQWHPNPLLGYAYTSYIYCTLFGGDPATLPDDCFSHTLIPGKNKIEKDAFMKGMRQAVKNALALKIE